MPETTNRVAARVITELTAKQTAARDFGVRPSDPLIIPRNAIPFFQISAVACPALGTQVVLATYTVPAQWLAVVTGVIFAFDGTPSLVPGAGDGVWTIDVNRPLGTRLGYVEKDFNAITWPLGSYAAGPWPVDFRHQANEILRVKFTPVANLAPGVPNYVTGGLIGYTWPGDRA